MTYNSIKTSIPNFNFEFGTNYVIHSDHSRKIEYFQLPGLKQVRITDVPKAVAFGTLISQDLIGNHSQYLFWKDNKITSDNYFVVTIYFIDMKEIELINIFHMKNKEFSDSRILVPLNHIIKLKEVEQEDIW